MKHFNLPDPKRKKHYWNSTHTHEHLMTKRTLQQRRHRKWKGPAKKKEWKAEILRRLQLKHAYTHTYDHYDNISGAGPYAKFPVAPQKWPRWTTHFCFRAVTEHNAKKVVNSCRCIVSEKNWRPDLCSHGCSLSRGKYENCATCSHILSYYNLSRNVSCFALSKRARAPTFQMFPKLLLFTHS